MKEDKETDTETSQGGRTGGERQRDEGSEVSQKLVRDIETRWAPEASGKGPFKLTPSKVQVGKPQHSSKSVWDLLILIQFACVNFCDTIADM